MIEIALSAILLCVLALILTLMIVSDYSDKKKTHVVMDVVNYIENITKENERLKTENEELRQVVDATNPWRWE